jgi:hypothetical protein
LFLGCRLDLNQEQYILDRKDYFWISLSVITFVTDIYIVGSLEDLFMELLQRIIVPVGGEAFNL